jgi:hypothetical protein
MAENSFYRKAYPRFWISVRGLNPNGKLIAKYLLDGPQTNRIGLYNFSEGKAIEDLEMLPQTFKQTFPKVLRHLSWEYDEHNRVLYIPTWWKWNPPENPNVLKGNMKDLSEVAHSTLYSSFYTNTEHLTPNLIETFVKTLPQTPPKSETETETETETEKTQTSPPDGSEFARSASPVFSCKHFEVLPEYHTELLKDYPGLTDKTLLVELKKMRDWLDDNPHRNKRTAKGHLKNPKLFIRNWLDKVILRLGPAPPKKPDPDCTICRGTGRDFYEEDGEKLVRDCQCLRRADG